MVLLYAAEPACVVPEFLPETIATLESGLQERVCDAVERVRAQFEDIPVELEFRRGVAYREVCRVGGEADIDLIVMPTHGRGGIAHVLFGSVAEKIVRLARCPVLTVRAFVSENPVNGYAQAIRADR